jgi:hypothetical protein
MNDLQTGKIRTYEDLIAERVRLEGLIANQKNIIRHDLDELKAGFKKEIKPAVDAAEFVKKLVRPETRNETIITVGTQIAIDLVMRRLLKKSNVLVQVLLPRILKNYSSHFFKKPVALSQRKPRLEYNGKFNGLEQERSNF